MLAALGGFFKRHRRKLIFTGAVIGGVLVLARVARRKLLELQEREADAYITHARRVHHFESNQRTCNMTVLSMLPTLRDNITKQLDCESLTAALRARPANKLEIWEDLKILSFARSVVAVYGACMLVVMLRVQLNVVGGYIYLDNAISSTRGPEAIRVPMEVQQRYLSSIQYLLGDGLSELTTEVKHAVQSVVGSVSLRQSVTLRELDGIISCVRTLVEGDGRQELSSFGKFMLAPEDDVLDGQVCGSREEELTAQKMLSETRDMMDSMDFWTVLRACLDRGFLRLIDGAAESFRQDQITGGRNMVGISAEWLPLAKVIPILDGQSHVVCSDAPNHFVQELLTMETVRNFAANVYEAFSMPEQLGK